MPGEKMAGTTVILCCALMMTNKYLFVRIQITSGIDKGVELHEFLAAKGVEGIVNGMDVEEWDPAAGVYDCVRIVGICLCVQVGTQRICQHN